MDKLMVPIFFILCTITLLTIFITTADLIDVFDKEKEDKDNGEG